MTHLTDVIEEYDKLIEEYDSVIKEATSIAWILALAPLVILLALGLFLVII